MAVNNKDFLVKNGLQVGGNTQITGSLTAAGLVYPVSDGDFMQAIVTDGSGNLSFENVDTVESDVTNQTGSLIPKGTPVYQTGSAGNTLTIAPSDAANAATMPAIGVAGSDIADGQTGRVIHFGYIHGVDTSGFSEGSRIYVADGGGYQEGRPTGETHVVQFLGVVTKVHATNGSGVVFGGGRSHAVPNLDDGNIFIGDNTNSPVTATLDTDLVPEATNQYFTNARAISAVEGAAHLTIDGGTLYVDTSNNYIGINDTSPNHALDVTGSIGIAGTEVIDSGGEVVTARLKDSGVTSGTYGSASAVPVLTIDAKGRVTSASSTAVAGVSSTAYNTSTGVLTINTSNGGSFTEDLGVGTADSPTFAGLTVDTNTLFVDAANNRVGIGTTSPSANLTVSATASPKIEVTDSDNSNTAFMQADGVNGAYFGSLTNHPVRLAPNNSTKLIVTTAGNVGIGTNNPLQKLSVAGRVNIDQQEDYYGAWIDGDSTADSWFAVGTWYTNGGRMTAGTNEGQGLHLYTHNTGHQLTLQKNGGNVGIGDTSPGARLEVRNNTDATDTILATANLTTAGNYHNLLLGDGANYAVGLRRHITVSNPSFLRPRLDFVVQDTDTYLPGDREVRMSIAHNGKVGIGTTNPATKLHVQSEGAGNSNGTFYLGIDTATNYPAMVIQTATGGNYSETHGLYIKNTAAGFGLRIDDAAGDTSPFIVDAAGRVGIGTTTPGGPLDVTSSRSTAYSQTQDQRSLAHIVARNGSDAAGRFASISLVNGGGTQAEGSINLVQTGNYLGDLTFKLRTGANSVDWRERMRIKSNGNVGIGTASPGEKLHVEGRAFFNTGSTYDNHSATAVTANIPVYIESITGVNGLLPSTGSASNGSHTLRLQSGGNFNGAMDFGSSGGVGGWIQYHDRANFETKYPLYLQPNGGNFYVGNGNELKISADSNSVNVEKPFGLAQYSSDPGATRDGQMYFNTTTKLARIYSNGGWSDINAEKDPHWNSVSAYITGNGVDQSGNWTVTPVNVSTSTSPGSPFSGNSTSSWYQINTGSNNYLNLTGGGLDLVDPGEHTDFTIEFWLYRSSTTSSYGHFYNIGGQSGQGVIKFQGDSAYGLYWYSSNGELINWGGGGTLTTGTWNYYVYQKQGSTNRTWRDGNLISTNTNSLPGGVASQFQLGGPFGGEYTAHYFDHLRVTAGVARYGSATTIPVQSAPWPTE